MSRPRPLLPFLVLALLVIAALPAVAAPAAPGSAPAPAFVLADAACPAVTPAVAPSADKAFRAIITPDFILCTCKTCKARPDVICQISPSGYSILCSDWAATHC